VSAATEAPSPTIPVTTPIATAGTAVGSQDTTSSGKTRRIKIVSASWDKTIKIWDLNTSSGQFSSTSTLTGHTGVRLIDSNNYNIYICLLWNSIDYLFIYIYRIFEGCQR